ncbi:hypothetical protein Tco_0832608 [Tanacetum coccineum]
MAQQIILAAQLVLKFQGIGICNNYDVLQSIPCSPECKIVGQILLNHSLSYALTATANVLAVYLQQSWKTVSKMPDIEDTIIFELDSQEIVYTVDMFHNTLQLLVETLENPFAVPANIEIIEFFMNRVGYQGVVDKVMDMFRDTLKLPVETPDNLFVVPATIEIIKSFMNRVGYQGVVDKLFHAMINRTNIDYAALLWWDFMNYAFLTEEIRVTDELKEYETVFVNVAVPMNQSQSVFSTQGTHRSHKEHPKVVDDDDDKEEKKEETNSDELTDIVSLSTPTTSKDLHKQRRISSKYSHLPHALRMICRRQGYMIRDMEQKSTDELIERNLKPIIVDTIIQDRDAFRSEVPDLVSKEFDSHAPQIIEELFKNYMKSNPQDQANDPALHDDHQEDDAPPKGGGRVKRQKTSKSSKSSRSSSSKRSVKDSKTYVSKQQQEWDAWEEETIIDEDEVIPEDEMLALKYGD